MSIDFRTLFLKSLPYLMSIAGGIILYTGAIDSAPNDNVRDLVINVSASLLSIPLVFLLYDYTNSRVTSQMRKNLANSVDDKLNILLFNLIILLREMMSVRTKLNLENLNRMLIWRAPEISRRLKITPRIIEMLHSYHTDLDTLLFRNSQNNVLSSQQVQILSSLARDMTRLINENKFRHNRHLSAKYTENMMSRILDWLDSDAVATLNLQNHFSPATLSEAPNVKKNNKK